MMRNVENKVRVQGMSSPMSSLLTKRLPLRGNMRRPLCALLEDSLQFSYPLWECCWCLVRKRSLILQLVLSADLLNLPLFFPHGLPDSLLLNITGFSVWSFPHVMKFCFNLLFFFITIVVQSSSGRASNIGIIVVQSLNCVQVFATPCIAACQASLSFTISWSLLKLMSIELVILFTHLILCHPFLVLPSIFPSITVFSNELALRIRLHQNIGVSASASVLPMNIQGWFTLGLPGLISLQFRSPLSQLFCGLHFSS